MSGRFSNKFVEMFLGWPSIRFLQTMLIGKKTWPPGGHGYFALYGYSENLNSLSSPPKVSVWFSNNFVEMFLGWPSFRFLKAKLIGLKLWPPVKVKTKNQVIDPGPSWPSCFKVLMASKLYRAMAHEADQDDLEIEIPDEIRKYAQWVSWNLTLS